MALKNLKNKFGPNSGKKRNFDSIHINAGGRHFENHTKLDDGLTKLRQSKPKISDTLNKFNQTKQKPSQAIDKFGPTKPKISDRLDIFGLTKPKISDTLDIFGSTKPKISDTLDTFKPTKPKISDTLDKQNFSNLEKLWETWVPNGTWTVGKYNGRSSLDTLLRGEIYSHTTPPTLIDRKLFVLDIEDDVNNHPFIGDTFDPRATFAKPGTFYFNTGKTFNRGTENPQITFETAGIDKQPHKSLSELGADLRRSGGWQALYNANHTPKEGGTFDGFFKPYHYGANVTRDKLDIRDNNGSYSLFNWSRTALLGMGEGEPYMVSDLPAFNSQRPFHSFATREVNLARSLVDAVRLGSFLTSPSGIQFIARQNLLGLLGSQTITPTLVGADGELDALIKSPQKYNKFYNPLSSIAVAGLKITGTDPNVLIRKDLGEAKYQPPLNLGTLEPDNNINLSFIDKGDQLKDSTKEFPFFPSGTISPKKGKKVGDKQTNLDFGKKEDNKYLEKLKLAHPNDNGIVTARKNGMPFYFKDMRDGAFIVFRAYIEGLTENVSPSWSSHNYMGRSEPVYTYERAERELNFTLKLVAQSSDELNSIYKKMNRLTSLCYPEYITDNYGKNRMKPPLTKFRLGDLFGKTDNEVLGFIKSLSYNIDQSSTYSVTDGKRVPRHINATISYQVIHGKLPELKNGNDAGNEDYKFYGFVGE